MGLLLCAMLLSAVFVFVLVPSMAPDCDGERQPPPVPAHLEQLMARVHALERTITALRVQYELLANQIEHDGRGERLPNGDRRKQAPLHEHHWTVERRQWQ